jgi:hypothetical protein
VVDWVKQHRLLKDGKSSKDLVATHNGFKDFLKGTFSFSTSASSTTW